MIGSVGLTCGWLRAEGGEDTEWNLKHVKQQTRRYELPHPSSTLIERIGLFSSIEE
jgi:hypothetical protein